MSFYKEPLQWIRFAMESVMGQTFGDFELILVCDNPSHEEAIAYVGSLQDNRIHLVINEVNIGPTKSFNRALALARGEYIARMDADDICLPERFSKQVAYLDAHPQVSVCATNTHTIDKNGNIIRRNRYDRKHDRALMFISNTIPHPTVMFRSSLLDLRKPFYNEDYIYSQDYELWQFLLLKGHVLHTLDEVLLLYRKNTEQISSAKRPIQEDLFEKARKSFISDWLLDRGIIMLEDSSDLNVMLHKASIAYAANECSELAHIIYALYLILGKEELKYRFRYLADRNLIIFKIRFIFTWRLMFAKRKELCRKQS